MSDSNVDPSGNTEQFMAFVQSGQAEPGRRTSLGLVIIGAAVLVAVAVLVALWLML
jgi:hypothetical protein